MRANIVGPPRSTTSISASMAGLPFRRIMLALRQLNLPPLNQCGWLPTLGKFTGGSQRITIAHQLGQPLAKGAALNWMRPAL